MAQERERSMWWHTAALRADIRNALTASGEAVSPADLHPMEQKSPTVINCGKDLSLMRKILCPEPRRKKK